MPYAFVAARRCKVSSTHLLPLVGDAGALLLRRREAFTGGCCRR